MTKKPAESRSSLFLMAAVLLFGPASPVASDLVHNEECFEIVVPDGFVFADVYEMVDFRIYGVRKVGDPRSWVAVYVGGAPDFPLDEAHVQARPGTVKSVLRAKGVQIVSLWNSGRLVSREVLLSLPPPRGVPRCPEFVHAWIADPPPGDVNLAMADRILMSIAVPSVTPSDPAGARCGQ